MPRISRGQREEWAAIHARSFLIYHEDEVQYSFDPERGGLSTIHDVVEYLTRSVDETDGEGTDGLEVAIWQGGRLRAVVVAGEDGRPRATVFA